jgi:hypothetical protein
MELTKSNFHFEVITPCREDEYTVMLSVDIKRAALNIVMQMKFKEDNENIKITYSGMVTDYEYRLNMDSFYKSFDIKENTITTSIVTKMLYSREDYIKKLIIEDRIIDKDLLKIYQETIKIFHTTINGDSTQVYISKNHIEPVSYTATLKSHYLKVTLNIQIGEKQNSIKYASLIEAVDKSIEPIRLNQTEQIITREWRECFITDSDEEIINSFISWGKLSKELTSTMIEISKELEAKDNIL